MKLYMVFILTKKGDINTSKIVGTPSGPLMGQSLGFLKFSETLDMSSNLLEEMFEGDSADTYAGKFLLVSMEG